MNEVMLANGKSKRSAIVLNIEPADKCHALRFDRLPSYNTALREAAMPFSIRLFRRFPVQCVVSYSAGPFTGVGTVWNLSRSGWRLSGDLPMRQGETLSLTVTLPNEQSILTTGRCSVVTEAGVCCGESCD